MKARHFLIVGGGGDFQGRLHDLVDDIATTVICRASVLSFVKDPSLHRAVVVINDEETTETWLHAARAVHQRRPVDTVVALTDVDQDRAALIAADLGLPFHALDTVVATTDKQFMRERLGQRGAEHVPHRLIESLGQLHAFFQEAGAPLILKPSRGRASIGVSVVMTADDLAAAYERTRGATGPRTAASIPIAERLVPGREFSVDAVTVAGKHIVFGVTEEFKDHATKIEIGHVVPAVIPAGDELAIIDHVRRCLDALDVRFGISHSEVILGPDGPFFIETHLRPVGDNICDLIADATDVSITDLWLRQIGGADLSTLAEVRSRAERPHYRGAAAIRFLSPDLSGVLEGIDGWEDVRATPGVQAAVQSIEDGTTLEGLQNVYSRLGYVRTIAETADEAFALAEKCVDRLRVRVRRL